jgi:hypothetical protein
MTPQEWLTQYDALEPTRDALGELGEEADKDPSLYPVLDERRADLNEKLAGLADYAASMFREADPCQHAPTDVTSGSTSGFCGKPAEAIRLPDGRVGYYCATHAAEVVARVMRRMAARRPSN